MRDLRLPAALLTAALVAGCGANAQSEPKAAESAQGPGGPQLRTTAPPWPAPTDAVKWIDAAGLPALGEEKTNVHYHAHLDIFANGQPVVVPAGIGIDQSKQKISPLHTHDTSGVVHIESEKNEKFTLGQLFTEWDVRLDKKCIGGLCAGDGKDLRFFIDGRPYAGDPTTITFKKHEEIAIQFGKPDTLPKPPSDYQFPAGL